MVAMKFSHTQLATFSGLLLIALTAADAWAQSAESQSYRDRDRGSGIPISMFGTFIEPGELIIYPFFEYYRDADFEYSPAELGRSLDQDFRGDYRASEELIFIGYGINDRFAVEIEAAIIQAKLETSADDPTDLPDEIDESGLGDVEGQLRWRWAHGSDTRPEFFGYFETVTPTQDEGSLIGTTDWEFKFGSGIIHSYSWATVAIRTAVEYDKAESKFETGEYALEALRRINDHTLVYLGVEGSEDEVEIIPELQLSFARIATLKLNSAFGATSKAAGWAPEVGLMLRFALD
jgi:hypothetical protein